MSDRQDNFFNVDAMEQGLRRKLAEGMETRVFAGDSAMISIVRVGPNQSGKLHAHPEEQWGFLFRGSGVRIQDGKEISVSAGDFWRTPGNVEHGFRAGAEGAVIFDVFAPPREDYKRPGSGFGN